MKSMRIAATLAMAAAMVAGPALAQEDDRNLVIQLEDGRVVIDLFEDVAPEHAKRLKELAEAGEYDNVAFHRVIEGFMAQTGDVAFGDMAEGYMAPRVGTGGSDLPDLAAEFSDIPFERGAVGMARSQDPDSANSQFFIVFDDAPFLNGQYTVVGEVIEGMEFVDAIQKGDPAANGAVDTPDRMLDVTVE